MFKEDSRARQTVEGANLFFASVRQLQCPWASRPKRRKGYPAGSLVCYYPSLPSVQEKFYHEGDGRIAVEPVSAFALRAGYPLRPRRSGSGLFSREEEEAICHDFLWQIFSSACLTYARTSNTTFRHADIST